LQTTIVGLQKLLQTNIYEGKCNFSYDCRKKTTSSRESINKILKENFILPDGHYLPNGTTPISQDNYFELFILRIYLPPSRSVEWNIPNFVPLANYPTLFSGDGTFLFFFIRKIRKPVPRQVYTTIRYQNYDI
jgi:hypothetical protein